MKLAMIAIAASLIVTGIAEAKSVYVKPYVRRDGTYVQGHYRTSPNGTALDNWSTQPNVNPYTLKQGKVDPYSPPRVTYPQPYLYTPPPVAPPSPPKVTVWQRLDY